MVNRGLFTTDFVKYRQITDALNPRFEVPFLPNLDDEGNDDDGDDDDGDDDDDIGVYISEFDALSMQPGFGIKIFRKSSGEAL